MPGPSSCPSPCSPLHLHAGEWSQDPTHGPHPSCGHDPALHRQPGGTTPAAGCRQHLPRQHANACPSRPLTAVHLAHSWFSVTAPGHSHQLIGGCPPCVCVGGLQCPCHCKLLMGWWLLCGSCSPHSPCYGLGDGDGDGDGRSWLSPCPQWPGCPEQELPDGAQHGHSPSFGPPQQPRGNKPKVG